MDILFPAAGSSAKPRPSALTAAEQQASRELEECTRKLTLATNIRTWDSSTIAALTHPNISFNTVNGDGDRRNSQEEYISYFDRINQASPDVKRELTSVDVNNIDLVAGVAEVTFFVDITESPEGVVRSRIVVGRWTRTGSNWKCRSIDSVRPFDESDDRATSLILGVDV